jgi:RNA polymerase primary sigma factor
MIGASGQRQPIRDGHRNAADTTQAMSDDVFRKLLDQLSPREREVLKERFGIEIDQHTDLDEIARRFEITRQRIREIEERALQELSEDPNPDSAA